MQYNPRLPSVAYMQKRAKKRMPRFAWEYLTSGIGEEKCIARNRAALENVLLSPRYLTDVSEVDTSCELFGHRYDLGIGISPVGLSNMMWPNAESILARAAQQANIPYTLSTMGTTKLEDIAKLAPDVAWFQLYVPRQRDVMQDIINRVKQAQYKVLVVTVDIPIGAKRDKELRNGLILPFKFTPQIIAQAMSCPAWSMQTLKQGIPSFVNLAPYGSLDNIKHLGEFLTQFFMPGVTLERIKEIREFWSGPLVVKGVLRNEDIKQCHEAGVDGVVISNHGARQLDAAPSSVQAFKNLDATLKENMTILLDSGIRYGLDVVRAKALGAQAAFTGRSFLFAAAAAGKDGGRQLIEIFRDEITRTLQQNGCVRFEGMGKEWLYD